MITFIIIQSITSVRLKNDSFFQTFLATSTTSTFLLNSLKQDYIDVKKFKRELDSLKYQLSLWTQNLLNSFKCNILLIVAL